jgi:transcriptional regulator with XRE-family HTH domain
MSLIMTFCHLEKSCMKKQYLPKPSELLSEYLAKARSWRGLSQDELAEKCGLDQAHISLFETGKRQPTLAHLIRLAHALQVPLQWFLTGSVKPGKEPEDTAFELFNLGVVDLWVGNARVPGAFRPSEQVVALAISGPRPEPRLLWAIPAVLAWNRWDPILLEGYGREGRVLQRLAWLADLAITIHHDQGFPGGCPGEDDLAEFLRRLPLPQSPDDFGDPSPEEPQNPLWKRWKINYVGSGNMGTFQQRANQLHLLRQEQERHAALGRLEGL